MPECGEGQAPNNERETKTILNCFLPDWIWYMLALIEKKAWLVGYSRSGGLTSDARAASRKKRKIQLP